jgi:hypothetical protein
VDALIAENRELVARIQDLERRRSALADVVTQNQIDCSFLGTWLKRAQPPRGDPKEAFQELIQKECQAKDELKRLNASQPH